MLHKSVEAALDRAQIAIVPIPTNIEDVTRWRILLIDEDIKNDIAIALSKTEFIRWGVSLFSS